ncbi:9765_t:CDS:1 [Diversispora eburnea]|uniref:9765_t:CDS:1 n=1 Tax=Diversispora eburnea TaxID=1213867 RepID=A0A9N8W535_9GLOM|nr:9765_t:CDS:1 [Diversispora eburnea]
MSLKKTQISTLYCSPPVNSIPSPQVPEMTRSLPIDIPMSSNFTYDEYDNIKTGWNHLKMLPSPLEDSNEIVLVKSPCTLGRIKSIKVNLCHYYLYGKDHWPYNQLPPKILENLMLNFI